MLEGRFSRTAIGAAGHRAAHQTLEGGRIFADPLAMQILGEEGEVALAEAVANPERRMLRLFIALRSRIAEDAALKAIDEGVRQIVVLGAGLDTFACRVSPRAGLVVYEVDRPETQIEKRRRLAWAGIEAPAHLVFAACDFERVGLAEALREAGFAENRRAMFIWLGVTPYLSRAAVLATLGYVAMLPAGGEIVFDYTNPAETMTDLVQRELYEKLAASVAELGEPFLSYFTTEDLHRELQRLGFTEIEDWGPAEILARLAPAAAGAPRKNGGHVIRAARDA